MAGTKPPPLRHYLNKGPLTTIAYRKRTGGFPPMVDICSAWTRQLDHFGIGFYRFE